MNRKREVKKKWMERKGVELKEGKELGRKKGEIKQEERIGRKE